MMEPWEERDYRRSDAIKRAVQAADKIIMTNTEGPEEQAYVTGRVAEILVGKAIQPLFTTMAKVDLDYDNAQRHPALIPREPDAHWFITELRQAMGLATHARAASPKSVWEETLRYVKEVAKHKLSCDDNHAHQVPRCCSPDCWCQRLSAA